MAAPFSQSGARATMAISSETTSIPAADLASLVKEATTDAAKCAQIMDVIEKRISDKSTRNWRQTTKALHLLEALLRAGSLPAARHAQDHLLALLDALKGTYFEDDEFPDAAANIRSTAKRITNALQDKSISPTSTSEKETASGKPLPPPPPPSKISTTAASTPTTSTTGGPSANAAAPSPPAKLPIRIWTDLSGSFKVEARFLAIADGNMVTLERPNGEQMGIMMDKMCSADLEYIIGLRQQGIDVSARKSVSSRTPSLHKAVTPNTDKQSASSAVAAASASGKSDSATAKSTLPAGFIIPATALKIDLTPSGKLGAGTSGIVRKAVYCNNNVAVKIISVRHLTKPQREAVIKEAEIMSRIVHPNAVRLFGVMIEEGLGLGLVMELLPRGCLKDYIERAALPPLAQRIRLARDVGHAMAYLHDTLNMVHRDLKALNVLLDDSGVFLRAKVCDFGFAHVKSLGMESSFWNGAVSPTKSQDEFSGGAIRGLKMQAAINMGSMTMNGGMGTPLWMAPELFDMNALISKPADVYAFTIVMTEIFSWAGPYCIAYEKIIPIMQNVIGLVQSGRRPELLLSPDVPLSIRSLIESGWDQNPDVRPTFRDITRVLEKAKADADYLSIHAPPLPTANPILMRDGRVYNIEQQQAGMVPIPQLQPLDNMIALQRTLPPQTAPLSASAPLLAGYAQQVPGGFNNSPVSPNYPPWQQQMAVPNGGVPAPYSLQQVGRSPSPSQQALYNNILNGGMVNSSAPLLNVVQPQSLVDRYGTSASPVKKGASMSNLGAQPSPGMGGPAIPQPVLRTMQQSDMLVRPHSQPSDVMMLPGSKHAVLWDVDETAGWFVMMGEPVEIVYKVKELQIDGKTLLALTERDMVEKLGITDFARRRRLGEMLDDYRMAGK